MKWILSLSTLTLLATPVVALSCNSTTNNDNNNDDENLSWRERIQSNEMRVVAWNADNVNSIAESLDVLDEMMEFYFPKNISTMTPYEFGEYLLNIYNLNGSGVVEMRLTFGDLTDSVIVDFKQPMLDILLTLDEGRGITPSTPRKPMTTVIQKLDILNGMATTQENADEMMRIFNKYSASLFLLDEPTTIVDVANIIQTYTPNPVIDGLFPILGAIPHQTLSNFTKLIAVFERMCLSMISSPAAIAWATAKGFTGDLDMMGREYIRIVMTKATS